MHDCVGCGADWYGDARYCGGCGLPHSVAGALLGMMPAVATGLFVAIVGAALGGAIPVPAATNASSGLVDMLLSAVLTTTVPYFDLVFGAVGGWAAAVALAGGRWRERAACGALVALGYAIALAALAGHRGLAIDVRLASAGALPLVGAGLGGAFADRLADGARLRWLGRVVPGQRYLSIALGSFLFVAIAMIVYGLVLTALVIALALLAIYVGLRVVGAVLSEGTSSQPSASSSGVAHAFSAPQPEPPPPPDALDLVTRKGRYGEHRGAIDKDGLIKDQYGFHEGRVDENGIIHGKHGEIVGAIDKDGIVKGKYGELLGSVDQHGSVKGKHGDYKGNVR